MTLLGVQNNFKPRPPHNTICIAIRRSQYNTYYNTHFPKKINKFLNDKVNNDKFRNKNL